MLSITVSKLDFIISHVKCALHFLLRLPGGGGADVDAHTARETTCSSDPNQPECAVCLCAIVAGDEIRRLRCGHVFHRDCFDRWVGHGRWTCPLCRNHLGNIPGAAGRREVLVFSFRQGGSSENKDVWWLR